MNYTNKSKFDTPDDAPEYIGDLMTQLRNELKNIEIALSKATGSTLVIGGTGMAGTISPTGSNSGGTTVPSDNIKSGVSSVTAGVSAFIPFPVAFASTPTVTLCFISGVDSSFGSVNTSALTVTPVGFSIPAEDIMVSGTVFYLAHLNT